MVTMNECPRCGGDGEVPVRTIPAVWYAYDGGSPAEDVYGECPECDGAGEIERDDEAVAS